MASMQMSEPNCPVSPDVLGTLYRAGTSSASNVIEGWSEKQRIELALFCYGRAHLRDLAMSIAATCDPTRLARSGAGNVGQALAIQSRHRGGSIPSGRISLGGTRH